MRMPDALHERPVTFKSGERITLVVGLRAGTVVGDPVLHDRRRDPNGAPLATQLVRWDDQPARPVPWHTWTLRPEPTEAEPQPELGGCA